MEELTIQNWAELSLEALKNSRRLLDDANLLGAHGRYASAFSCASLAADELGKHVLINNFFGYKDPSQENRRALMLALRNHAEKIGELVLYALLSDLAAGSAPADYANLHKRRLDATYVDLSTTTNAVTTPDTEITRHEYDAIAASVERLIAASEARYSHTDVETLSQEFIAYQASVDERRSKRRAALLAAVLVAGIALLARTSNAAVTLDSLESLDPLEERSKADEEEDGREAETTVASSTIRTDSG